jgi:PAS domain S-box-containing protein
MRINSPVLESEYLLENDLVLVTKTDTKGLITYCNKAFSNVSGYSIYELLGKPHNLVRHPDVPASIFADLWKTIKSGNSWHGVIKNRRKNAEYYWVYANVSPLYKNDELMGYVSIRFKPSDLEIQKAKEYIAAIHSGESVSCIQHAPDKSYLASLQARLAEKFVSHDVYIEECEYEQQIAVGYMNKLIALDSIRDSSVQYYLKPTENFSGDLIAIDRTPDGRLHLLLADSTGHGLSAALAAMPIIHPFYSMTSKGFSISAISKEINKKIKESLPTSHFVAAIIISIDPKEKMIEVWCGGCPPPFTYKNGGPITHQFKSKHLALGILPPELFDESVEYYAYEGNSQKLVMFSDGLNELKLESGDQFEVDHLFNSIQEFEPFTNWDQLIEKIEQLNSEEVNGNDDIALIVAKCESGENLFELKSPSIQKSLQPKEGKVVWQFSLVLTAYQIQRTDVAPLLLDVVQQIEKDKEKGKGIFLVLSELYNNALDHGLLKLSSTLKQHGDGLEKYYAERKERLDRIDSGQIQINLEKIINTDATETLRIRVKDSGDGFDFNRISNVITNDSQFHGRGLALLRQICNSVSFFNEGSEILVELDLEH